MNIDKHLNLSPNTLELCMQHNLVHIVLLGISIVVNLSSNSFLEIGIHKSLNFDPNIEEGRKDYNLVHKYLLDSRMI